MSVDDSVLDKPYHYSVVDWVGYFWSGKHHRAVKGINLVTLYYTDTSGRHMPINFRICDKSEGKTKNDYFREMQIEVLDIKYYADHSHCRLVFDRTGSYFLRVQVASS